MFAHFALILSEYSDVKLIDHAQILYFMALPVLWVGVHGHWKTQQLNQMATYMPNFMDIDQDIMQLSYAMQVILAILLSSFC